MNHAHLFHQAVFHAEAAKDLARVRIEIDAVAMAGRQPEDEFGAGVGPCRNRIGRRHRAVRGRGARTLQQGVRSQRLSGRFHPQQMGIEQGLDLRLEAVDRSCHGEYDQERHDEQAGVKVPAPQHAIGGRGGGHGARQRGRWQGRQRGRRGGHRRYEMRSIASCRRIPRVARRIVRPNAASARMRPQVGPRGAASAVSR